MSDAFGDGIPFDAIPEVSVGVGLPVVGESCFGGFGLVLTGFEVVFEGVDEGVGCGFKGCSGEVLEPFEGAWRRLGVLLGG